MHEAPESDDHHADWRGECAALKAVVDGVPERDAVSKWELLAAAKVFRSSSAPGADGISGGLLKRWACCFGEQLADLLFSEFQVLRDSWDPLTVQVTMESTIGAIPKSVDKLRPITVSATLARCVLARLARRSRRALRAKLDGMGQYRQTNVFSCIARILEGVTRCIEVAEDDSSGRSAPWCVTSVDEKNAFNSASQRALADAARRLMWVAPEMAAAALRSQCSVQRGACIPMVLRGTHSEDEHVRYLVRRWARGGAQGSPDMPALFGMVMAIVDEMAQVKAATLSLRSTDAEVQRCLWEAFQAAAPGLAGVPLGGGATANGGAVA